MLAGMFATVLVAVFLVVVAAVPPWFAPQKSDVHR
jgi:hypothetical protein